MLLSRIPSRPIRYAIIAAHTAREALSNYEVDLTKVEQSLADKVDALTTKVDALLERLEAMDEAIDETPAPAKPKAKRKPQGKKWAISS